MWPRIISQLEQVAELLPYLKHATPVIDKLLASRSANDSVVASMVEGVRNDLAKLGLANTAASEQLSQLSVELKNHASTIEETRSLTTSLGHGVIALERQMRTLRTLLVLALVFLAALTFMVLWLVVAHSRA